MRIEVPDTAPQRGGLLSVVAPTPVEGHAGFDGVTYERVSHGVPAVVPESDTEKDFPEPGDPYQGTPFTIYRGATLSLFDTADAGKIAADVFKGGETVAVELGVQPLLNAAAVDITPTAGTAVSVLAAIGLLEQYAATHYSGLPLLHVNRYGASFVLDKAKVDTQSWKAHTYQGTPIVNGGGYTLNGPGDSAPAGDDFWVYMSGQVRIFATAPVITETHAISTNRKIGLVERTFIPVVEHFVAAVLVTP